MIEREFVKEKIKYNKIAEFVQSKISKNAGVSEVLIEKTPLGERITINAVKPGLVIGRGGKSIKDLTNSIKSKFKLENPQIEVKEIIIPDLSAQVVAKRITSSLERFGPKRFKAIAYRSLQNVMNAGAIGVEIRIGGRGVPGQRSMNWWFHDGYLKKCGFVSDYLINKAISRADLKSGSVGVQVSIMLPGTPLPDHVEIKEIEVPVVAKAEEKVEKVEEKSEEKKKVKKEKAEKPKKKVEKKTTKKKAPAKKTTKKKETKPKKETKTKKKEVKK
jgi:small subunit ribosomal protein S3